MRKIILTILIGLTCICAFGLTACSGGDNGGETPPIHTHDYKTLKFDNDNHWFECECGDKSNKIPHNLVNNLCLCGYEKIEEHTHDYKTLKFDNGNHWFECECGDKSAEEEHEYLNGRCEDCDSIDPTYITEGLEFILINNGTEYEVSRYRGTSTEVIIPTFCQNKPVTSIGEDAFYDCDSLRSIEIPNSVTSIGDYAFSNCDSLTSIEIPNSVTSIGNETFSECRSLTSIEIPNSVTSIGDYAFYDCDSLTSVTIGNSVTSIGNQAFSDCDSLNYNIKNELKYLGNSNNPYLYLAGVDEYITTATIDNNCRFIGTEAFSGCHSLTSIEIPNSVTSIGERAFYYCDSLRSIDVAEDNPNYKDIDGNLYTKDGKVLLQYVIGKTATEFIIPSSVTSIGDYAFSDCHSLTSIEIPNSVTSIGGLAFSECDSLRSIDVAEDNPNYKDIDGNLYTKDGKVLLQYVIGKTATEFIIPSSVTSIGDYAFSDCHSLTSIEIPNSVTSIGDYAFSYCDSLTSVTIGNSVTSIGEGAFCGCGSLTSIEIPNSVTSIGNFAFSYCSSLQSIEIPDSVTSIGGYVFESCYSLTTIYCQAESQPTGWYSNWKSSCSAEVIWGY